MPRPGENESPFKKDEPVSRSRKWILIVFYFWMISALIILAGCFLDPGSLGNLLVWAEVITPAWVIMRDPDYFVIYSFLTKMVLLIVMATTMIVMTVQLWRIGRAAKFCQEKRNFDVMAAAVRSQQLFWGIAAVGTTGGAIIMAMLCFQMVPKIKAGEELFNQEKKAPQTQTSQP